MVRGEMVLMKGVRIGTLYKLLGNVDLTRCNNIVAPKIDSTATQLDSMSTQLEPSQFKPTRKYMMKSNQPSYGKRMGCIGEK